MESDTETGERRTSSGKQSKTHWIAFLKPNAPRQTAERSGASLDAVVGASESKGE